MSTPSPTANSIDTIPMADVARIEPLSRVLLFACSIDLFFMFPPLLSVPFPIANCRFMWLRRVSTKLAIGNRQLKYRELPGSNSFRIEIHLHCFGDWQGRISVAHSTGRAGLSSGVNLLRFRLFNFGRSYWRCHWSLFVLS